MLGKNAIAPVLADNWKLNVHSVWYTIRNTGPWMGYPVIVIRLAGCNLRCFWCDVDFERGAKEIEVDALVNTIVGLSRTHRVRKVLITGGEPMIQAGIVSLIHQLARQYIRFEIETNGLEWPAKMETVLPFVTINVSPKTQHIIEQVTRFAGAWSYVIAAGETHVTDGLPMMSTQERDEPTKIARPFHRYSNTFVQPRNDGDPIKNKANTDAAIKIAMKFGYRLSLQTNKMVGLD